MLRSVFEFDEGWVCFTLALVFPDRVERSQDVIAYFCNSARCVQDVQLVSSRISVPQFSKLFQETRCPSGNELEEVFGEKPASLKLRL